MPESNRSWIASGIGDAACAALAEGLQASEVWSLLLDVMERRAAQRTPPHLMRQFAQDGFVRPAFIDQRTAVALDAHLFAAAAAFEAVELSPLAPLGSSSAVAIASQNKIVSALRGTEVVADPTNVLALECASRLRTAPGSVVRLATSHRCVRAQPVPKGPGFSQHFRIFCLASAGRERQGHGFAVDALSEQIATHLAALARLEQHGYALPARRVTLLATPEKAAAADRAAETIRGVPVERKPLEHRYYDGLRFMIDAGDSPGGGIPLIDGGCFDWVGKLASNRRFAFVASGMGSQLIAYMFRKA
jgi:hypothetical protein